LPYNGNGVSDQEQESSPQAILDGLDRPVVTRDLFHVSRTAWRAFVHPLAQQLKSGGCPRLLNTNVLHLIYESVKL